jgi:hypothetical protein
MSSPRPSVSRRRLAVVAFACAACTDAGPGDVAPTPVAPPVARAEVHRPGEGESFADSFDAPELGARWRADDGVADVAGGELVVALGNGGPGVVAATPVDATRSQLWTTCVRYAGGADAATVCRIAAASGGELRVVAGRGAAPGLRVQVDALDGETLSWTKARGWGPASAEPALATAVDDEYLAVGIELEASEGAPRLRALAWNRAVPGGSFDQGYRLFLVTDWIAWSRVAPAPEGRFALGGGGAEGRLHVEWVRHASGPAVHAWVNGKASAQGSYDTRHWRSYDGERFVPGDDAAPALPHGPDGAWDSHYAKDAWIVQDEDGVYYLFHSGKPKGGAYSIGVARSAHVDGPWIKYEGSPILANRPGTGESGLQFPAVVKDLAHPDPEWRWQMLYDGYRFEPVSHSIFLATAPHPLGPWTRRGAVLGPGEPGEFDDLGCAGGIPLWWNGRWEVWYPGLREKGDTGVWSIGRATGPSLDRLERDGFGPRVRQSDGAEGRLAGPVEGRFLPLDDTAGFARDAIVLVTDDDVKNHYATSRIRRVTEDGIELYHSLSGFDPSRPTIVRQFDRASLWPRHIARVGDEWWLYVNLFGTFRGAPFGLRTFDENTALLKHSAADPAGATFEFDWPVNPPIARGVVNNDRSSENIALITTPVERR